MTAPYTAVSVSVPPPAVVRCIVDDMWRRAAAVLIGLINAMTTKMELFHLQFLRT